MDTLKMNSNNGSHDKFKDIYNIMLLSIQRITIYFVLLIILPLETSFSYLDSSGIYTSCSDKFILVNTDFDEFLEGPISKVRLEIETHRRFGLEGEEINGGESFYKEEKYRAWGLGTTFWSTIFLKSNIDSILMEDTTGHKGIGTFCSFDTLYKLELISTSDNKTNVYFSHFDLERNQLRIIKANNFYIVKLSKRVAPVLKKYLKELFNKINNYNFSCPDK